MRTRFIIIIIASLLLTSTLTRAQVSEELDFPPVKIEFYKIVKAIAQLRALGTYQPLDHLMDHQPRGEPVPVVVDESSEAVQVVRERFNAIQRFLFKDSMPAELVFCNHCDGHRTIDRLVVYVDASFMQRLVGNPMYDQNLVDLDLAHAFSHYLIERYIISIDGLKSPGGQYSAYVDWLPLGKVYTPLERVYKSSNYHAEVDAFASAILLLMGKTVPDYFPIVDEWRQGRPANEIRLEIFADQEIRLNTIRWIRENWPVNAITPSVPRSQLLSQEPREKDEQALHPKMDSGR